MTDTPAAVELSGVHKWYGDYHALRDVTLSVASGEKIVVCGPSGSGKSTMIRCVNRLEAHHRGHIRVGGVELTGDRFGEHRECLKEHPAFHDSFPGSASAEQVPMNQPRPEPVDIEIKGFLDDRGAKRSGIERAEPEIMVAGHDRDDRVRLDAARDERGGDVPSGRVELGPGQGAPLAGRHAGAARHLVAVRRSVAVRRDRPLHQVEDRAPLDRLLDVTAFVSDRHPGIVAPAPTARAKVVRPIAS